MPILDVEMVLPAGARAPRGMSAAIAEAAADVFHSAPGHTWVRLRELSEENYSESGGGPGPDVQPVFVHVLKAVVPSEAELESEVTALASAIARACNRAVENVHILYDQPAAGRIAFGGRLLRR